MIFENNRKRKHEDDDYNSFFKKPKIDTSISQSDKQIIKSEITKQLYFYCIYSDPLQNTIYNILKKYLKYEMEGTKYISKNIDAPSTINSFVKQQIQKITLNGKQLLPENQKSLINEITKEIENAMKESNLIAVILQMLLILQKQHQREGNAGPEGNKKNDFSSSQPSFKR